LPKFPLPGFSAFILRSIRPEEFVKRAAFALIACVVLYDKKASDENIAAFIPLIEKAADDPRNFVKKAVNWALRHIGKRNWSLNRIALQTARNLRHREEKSARWIVADAIRELESAAVQNRLKEPSPE
jgi:3-methyladenine DNA glycosylase AlkD